MKKNLKMCAVLYKAAEAFISNEDEFGIFCQGYTAGLMSFAIFGAPEEEREYKNAVDDVGVDEVGMVSARIKALYAMYLDGKRIFEMRSVNDPCGMLASSLRQAALGDLERNLAGRRDGEEEKP